MYDSVKAIFSGWDRNLETINALKNSEIEVISYSFGAQNYYLENHFQMPFYEQYRKFKDHFNASGGLKANASIYKLEHTEVYFEGQDSILLNEGVVCKEFCVGAGVSKLETCGCLINSYEVNFTRHYFDDVIFSMQLGMYNFHHFLLEVFPIIWLYREEFRGKTFVISSSGDSRFVEEIFRFFEIDIKVELIPLRAKCYFSNSILMSHLPSRVYPVQILKQMRHFAKEKLDKLSVGANVANAASVIFLARGDLSRDRRILLNEDELVSYLKLNLGPLEIVRPAKIEFQVMVQTLQNAKTVVGVTGGSLANLLWAEHLERFIELVPQGYPGVTESQELSKIFDFEYQKISTKSVQTNISFANSDQMFLPPQSAL